MVIKMSNLYLIDGSGIAYRAFFALGDWMQSSNGIPTNAVYGVCRMMIKIINDFIEKNNDGIVFILDKKTKTYRNELLKTYKAQRKKTPDEFIEQIPYIYELIDNLGIKTIALDNYEADDVIATMALKFKNDYDNIFIITSDKDMMQLIKDNIYILRPEKGVSDIRKYDSKAVENKMGVPPDKIIDLLALMGDSSDNIPGVKGIGIKSAQKLLLEHQNIDKIYENIDSIKGASKKKLEEGKESAELSKKLVKLMTNAPIELDKSDFLFKGFSDNLEGFLNKLDFNTIIKELGFNDQKDVSSTDFSKKGQYKLLNQENFDEILRLVNKNEYIVFDLETTSLDPQRADILGLAVSFKPFEAYYLNLSNLNNNQIKDTLNSFFNAAKNKKLIGQNLKYDLSVLLIKGIEVKNIYFDTMIGSYLVNSDSRKFNMDDLADQYLNYKTTKYKDLFSGKGNLFTKSLKDIDINKVADYASEDADITFRLYEKIYPIIKKYDLEKVNNNIEIPIIPILSKMETNGVYFDINYLKNLENEYNLILNDINRSMENIVGYSFNPNSPKQVGELLFEKLNLKGKKKNKSGSYSTDAESLEYLKNDHPIAEKLLEYRKYQKLLSTYIIAIPKLVNKITGRVHTSFNQTGTATGRLSSSDPNLQNLPIKDEDGVRIRKAIRAQKDNYLLLSADYSQIELRVLAHLSKDKTLINAYKNNDDIHSITSAKIFGISENEVTENQRRIGKMVNFSLVYGAQAYGLSQKLDIPYYEAQSFIDKYFDLYKDVGKYMEECQKVSKEKGYIETIFGRKRFINNIRTGSHDIKRIVINSPVQGTAADIMKMAMIKINDKLPERCKMILQVHDEIVIELPEEDLDKIKKIVTENMENAVELSIPLKVDVSYGKIWDK